MFSRFPFSLEQLPRPRHCCCLSLRAGCLLAALVSIVYSTVGLAQCLAGAWELVRVGAQAQAAGPDAGQDAGQGAGQGAGQDAVLQWLVLASVAAVLLVSLLLSALMLLGVLKEAVSLIRPWVVFKSLQLAGAVLLLLAAGATHAAQVAAGAGQDALLMLAAQFLTILVRFYMLSVAAAYCGELLQRGAETERLKRLHHGSWYTDL